MAQSYDDLKTIEKTFNECVCPAATFFPKTHSIFKESSQSNDLEKPVKHTKLYAYISILKINSDKLFIILKSPYETGFFLEISVPLSIIPEVQKVYDDNLNMILPVVNLPILNYYNAYGSLASWSIFNLKEGKGKSRLMITPTGLRFEDLSHPFLNDKYDILLSENYHFDSKEVSIINQWKEFVAFVEIPWWKLFEEVKNKKQQDEE